MSLKSHAKRSLVATGAVAFAALGVAAPANAAIDKQLVYQCKFPIIAPGTISMDIQGPDIPSEWPTGLATPKWAITAKATLNAPIPAAMSAIDGLASIEGKATAKADLVLTRADGTFNVAANVNMTVPKTPFTPTDDEEATLDVNASGSAPSQYQDDPATGKIVLRSIALNMIARDASGKALQLAPVTKDWENKAWVDSDNNPDTFDVICRLDPATPGQTLDLADIAFISDDNQAPSAPGATTGTAGDESAALSWGAATDADGTVASYNVYQDGVKVTSVPGTSANITGLTNDTAYSFQISAVDDKGKEGAKNAAVSVTPKDIVTPQKPTTPPSAPAQAGDIKQTSAIIRWGAATDPDGTIKGYRITVEDETKNVGPDARSVEFTGLGAGSQYEARVWAIDNQDQLSAQPLLVSFETIEDTTNFPPTKPGTPTLDGAATESSVKLTWTASTDVDGIKGYDVYQDGVKLAAQAATNSTTISGLKAGTSYKFKVVAVDTKGLAGEASGEATIATAADKTPPSNPTVTLAPSSTSILVKWTPSTDASGIAGYDVYNGATKVGSTDGAATQFNVTGLTASTSYTFKVVARDNAGNASTGGSATGSTTSGGNLIRYKYNLSGNALIKTLSKGTLPITGGIQAELDPTTGSLEADLTLNPTSGRLTALGFLPVTAKIAFAPSGKTVGTLLDGELNTTSKVRIKVQEVKLFGAIPLAGGNSCQTKSLSEIKLKNTQEFFNYLQGGPIAGTFAISDLNGCGLLNGLVSPLTAGGGNQLNLNLTNPTKW